ncbi:MAG: hypothetical protein HZB29_13880 [Nitrospinae bacterium]|nr:hypothetical protein [Nitrospinota bacterium]
MNPVNSRPLLIVPFGVFPHAKGDQVIDRPAAKRILNRMSSWGRDIVVDYLHESFKQCGRAPAAGWVKSATARLTEDGIEAVIEWTGDAMKSINAKEYRFLSPVFESDGGMITGLVNLGLTNNPNINSMPPLINQLSIQENQMPKTLIESLKSSLGLAPGAAEADVLSAVEALIKRPGSIAGILGGKVALLGLAPEATDEQIAAKIEELATACAETKESSTGQLVNDAIAAGKLSPALAGWANNLGRNNPESLRVFLLNSSPAIPLGGIITPCGKPAAGKLTESESNVMRLLNLSESDFAKYGS